MSSIIRNNILRLGLITLLQVLLFKRISLDLGSFSYVHFLIYPLIILLLPIRIPKSSVVFIGFLIGIVLDIFYDSPGVHASALVFTAYARGVVLNTLEPFEGYAVDISPTINRMGWQWFLTYAGILMFLHCLVYFSMSYFSFVYIKEIILDTLFSFVASFVMIILISTIFKSD